MKGINTISVIAEKFFYAQQGTIKVKKYFTP